MSLSSLFFSFFSLFSLSLSLFASWQVPRVTDHESWVGGQRVVCTLFHETPMPTPFLHNSVPTHHPQLISLLQNCCNCSSRFHFRSTYYYSFGLSVFLGPTVIFYYYLLLFVIYLTKFVVNVDQMGYLGVHNSSKLKIWFKVKKFPHIISWQNKCTMHCQKYNLRFMNLCGCLVLVCNLGQTFMT
jgi:hypothetical protein